MQGLTNVGEQFANAIHSLTGVRRTTVLNTIANTRPSIASNVVAVNAEDEHPVTNNDFQEEGSLENTPPASGILTDVQFFMTALSNQFLYLEENGFTAYLENFTKDIACGEMYHAEVLEITRASQVFEMLRNVKSLAKSALTGETIPQTKFADRIVSQFVLPAGYTAYSPWIRAYDLVERAQRHEVLIRDPISTVINKWRSKSKQFPRGQMFHETYAVAAMRTNLLTFSYFIESRKVQWFCGDDPKINPGSGATAWIHLLKYEKKKKANEPPPTVHGRSLRSPYIKSQPR